MVLGGEDDILHPGGFRVARPGGRVVEVGVEVAEVAVVVLVVEPFAVFDPLVAGGEGVEAPVDEEAEAVVGEPGGVGGCGGDFRQCDSAHRLPSSYAGSVVPIESDLSEKPQRDP